MLPCAAAAFAPFETDRCVALPCAGIAGRTLLPIADASKGISAMSSRISKPRPSQNAFCSSSLLLIFASIRWALCMIAAGISRARPALTFDRSSMQSSLQTRLTTRRRPFSMLYSESSLTSCLAARTAPREVDVGLAAL